MSASGPRRAIPSSRAISQFMQRMPRSDTGPEIALRRALHRRGLRFRINVPTLPGRPDIVLSRAKIAIFVDGCFWHGCPAHAVAPKSNDSFWASKIAGNKARDQRVSEQLRSLGWTVIRTWEHEDPEATAETIAAAWNRAVGSTVRQR